MLENSDLRRDLLHSYCTADLRLCFRIGRIPVFSRHGSFIASIYMDEDRLQYQAFDEVIVGYASGGKACHFGRRSAATNADLFRIGAG